MSHATAAVLEPVGEARIALESVDVSASLQGLYSNVTVTQVYRNLEEQSIEAVYSFPLPMDAVLLDLVLELGERTLRGVVKARKEADEDYEQAIEDGGSAVLLQRSASGVYTLNVGNLLPGEKAVVRFRYGQLHRWQGDSLRFHLPTTIAPRYGDPAAAGLEAHQQPEYVLDADHGFSLKLRIEGELEKAELESPTHRVEQSSQDGFKQISLAGGTSAMDRDFVLVLRKPDAWKGEAMLAKDGDQHMVFTAFHPEFAAGTDRAPRCLKLVVDCSGSMGGDSIAQARAALAEILTLLKPHDYFNLVKFGSTHDVLFPQPVIASNENIAIASHFVGRIDADMGGTDIGEALEAAYRSAAPDGMSADLLLITDGQVWQDQDVIDQAHHSRHRVFTVGVGTSVSEEFLRTLAVSTSGACELVSPRENMAERIVRHFKRIGQARTRSVEVNWPVEPVLQSPSQVQTVYSGDTLHLFGWFDEKPTGMVTLAMVLEDGVTETASVSLTSRNPLEEELAADLPRMAVSSRLATLDEEEAAVLAEQYQLVTEQTSCVLVLDRGDDEKTAQIPALRKVPHVLAAGWGGTGILFASYANLRCASNRAMKSSRPRIFASASYDHSMGDAMLRPRAIGDDHDSDESDLQMRRAARNASLREFTQFITALNNRYPESSAASLDISTISQLVDLGLGQKFADKLLEYLAISDLDEHEIVVVFLEKLLRQQFQQHHATARLTRHTRRIILQASKGVTSKDPARIRTFVKAYAEIGKILGGV